MRKVFIFLGIMVISLVLVGCTGGEDTSTPPTYTGIRVEGELPVDGTEFTTLYRAKQETVEVEIAISNPDSLTIKSIVINGITYNSHRFKDTSTFTNIFFDMNVGTELEDTVYSVDEVNYLSGENTKTVDITSNNEFEIYVYKDLPSVERENYALTKNTISVDFDVVDVDGVIDTTTLRAELYSGETLTDTIVMTAGVNNITFEDLLSNKFYELKVVASYDIDDNTGVKTDVTLYSESYLTLSNGAPSAIISNRVTDSNKVTFDVEVTDTDTVLEDGGLKAIIFNGETQLTDAEYIITITGSTAKVEFDNLLNDNTYTIKIIADYDLKNGEGVLTDRILASQSFTTLPRSVPTPEIVGLNLLENSIEFDLVIDDPLGIIDPDSVIANLYIDDVLVDTANVVGTYVDMQISNLLADSIIVIELIADYDLNDGNGVQEDQIIHTVEYSTQINQVPSIEMNNIVVEQGYVTLLFTAIDDNDTLYGPLVAVLKEDDTIVQTIMFNVDETEIIFDYATASGTNYYIEIYATYDLRDGLGRQEDQTLRSILSYSEEDKAPIAEINDVVTDTESIEFELNVIDADNTIIPDTITVYLYHLGVVVDSKDILTAGKQTVTFDDLILSNNEYEITVEVDYQLVQLLEEQLLQSQVVNTLPKEIPSAELKNEVATIDSISFDLLIEDLHGVITEDTVYATLYYEGNPVDSILLDEEENFISTFDDEILSNSNYTIEITTSYNLNDGNGEDVLTLATFDIKTVAKITPTAEYRSTFSNKTTIEVEVYVTDDDTVIVPGTLYAVLVLDDVQLNSTKQLISTGLTPTVRFEDLNSDERYYVRIIADLDFNDDIVLDPEQVVHEESITTDAFTNITVEVDDVRATSTTIEIDLDVSDTQSVYEENLEAVAYDGLTPFASTPFGLGDSQTIIIEGLDSDTEYYVVIEADVDLNTSEGVIEDYELYAEYKFTEAATPPTDNLVMFESETIGQKTASFSIAIDDDEGFLTSDYITATLVQYNGEEPFTYIIAPNATTTIDLIDLLSNNDYQLILTATYNIGEGGADEDFEYIYEFSTAALTVPLVTIGAVQTWTSPNLTVGVAVGLDNDAVANDGEWYAVLYRDGVAVDSVALLEDTNNNVTFATYDHTDGHMYTIVVTADIQLNELDALDPDYETETTVMIESRTFISGGN